MSNAALFRSRLRRAIKVHPEWNALRPTLSFDLASATMTQLREIADRLGIDAFAIANDASAPEDNGQGERTPEEMGDALDALNDAPINVPAPATDVSGVAGQLAGLIASIAGQSLRPEQIAQLVRHEIKRALADVPAVVIEVRKAGDLMGKVEGHKHPKFQALLTAACARMGDGFHPNLWIAGPAGSGKTTAARMVAKAMGAEFRYTGAVGMAHEMVGFTDAGGTYHRTAFRDAFEHGGVYLWDEVDGSDNSALLAVNGALANGIAAFPDGMILRHPDSVLMAAANTWGHGATADYVGRAKIDAAFRDRFAVKIHWDYDTALEVAISGNPDFARRVQAARERARAAGLKVVITPRASIGGAALIASGFTPDQAAEMTYLADLSKDQRKVVEGA
jgi:hypothetical protein